MILPDLWMHRTGPDHLGLGRFLPRTLCLLRRTGAPSSKQGKNGKRDQYGAEEKSSGDAKGVAVFHEYFLKRENGFAADHGNASRDAVHIPKVLKHPIDLQSHVGVESIGGSQLGPVFLDLPLQ